MCTQVLSRRSSIKFGDDDDSYLVRYSIWSSAIISHLVHASSIVDG